MPRTGKSSAIEELDATNQTMGRLMRAARTCSSCARTCARNSRSSSEVMLSALAMMGTCQAVAECHQATQRPTGRLHLHVISEKEDISYGTKSRPCA